MCGGAWCSEVRDRKKKAETDVQTDGPLTKWRTRHTLKNTQKAPRLFVDRLAWSGSPTVCIAAADTQSTSSCARPDNVAPLDSVDAGPSGSPVSAVAPRGPETTRLLSSSGWVRLCWLRWRAQCTNPISRQTCPGGYPLAGFPCSRRDPEWSVSVKLLAGLACVLGSGRDQRALGTWTHRSKVRQMAMMKGGVYGGMSVCVCVRGWTRKRVVSGEW